MSTESEITATVIEKKVRGPITKAFLVISCTRDKRLC